MVIAVLAKPAVNCLGKNFITFSLIDCIIIAN